MAEFDLIERIRVRAMAREGVLLGIGDDAAVLHVPAGHELVVTAELPSAEVAAQLRQPTSRPELQVESLNVDLAGTPIEWARAWFAGDRVKLTIGHDEHA